MKLTKWNITELTGYEPITTFWMDFCIADNFGLEAIKDTLKNATEGWKHDVKYFTELAMVVNHKCWEHWHRSQKPEMAYLPNHAEIGQFYKDSYYKLLDMADRIFKGADIQYFYQTLD